MNILVTGSKGFIGKNLVSTLMHHDKWEIMEFGRDTKPELLQQYCRSCDFVIHLAGINRPQRIHEYAEGNMRFTERLLGFLRESGNPCPVLLASSIQAGEDNPYGRSKKAAEDIVLSHGEAMKTKVFIYRFAHVFGKWARPDYNSVVATFCHHVSRNEAIVLNDPEAVLELVYIDDLVSEIMKALNGRESRECGYCKVPLSYHKTVGEIAAYIKEFAKMNERREIPGLGDDFIKKLYSTYMSYLPHERMKYGLIMNCDDRGSFTELLRTDGSGQVSINISRADTVKGNHWHHTKHEKFLVVKGEGIIRLRKLGEEKVLTIPVSGSKLEVVEIPPGYVHNIENTGKEDMVTVIWANEVFCSDFPDTYFAEVQGWTS